MAYTLPVDETPQPGLCLLLLDEPRTFPAFREEQVRRYLHDHYRHYEPLMAFGPYHAMLPVEVRRRAVAEQFDVPRFLRAIEDLEVQLAPEEIAEDLLCLIASS